MTGGEQMKKSPPIVSLVAMLLVVPVSAADVSGVWSLRLLTKDGHGGGVGRATVTLKQDGEKLTGTCVIDSTDLEFTVVGKVTDKTLTWRCASKGRPGASFNGAIDSTEGQMTGEWTTPARVQGTFKGSRRPK
jgi:hypothetical protein